MRTGAGSSCDRLAGSEYLGGQQAMPDQERIVPCPNCRKPVRWGGGNRHRPFCSERCRLIDLGEWAKERYRIAGEPAPAPSEDD